MLKQKLKFNIFNKIVLMTMLIFFVIGINFASALDNKQENNNFKLDLQSNRKDFSFSESPKLEFKFAKKRSLINYLGAFFKGIIIDEYKNIKINSLILDEQGKTIDNIDTQINYRKKGKFNIDLLKNNRELKPGKYKLIITVKDEKITNNQEIKFNQDFTWGVLAFNMNKSVYLLGEEAYIQMAVLDDNGNTLCNADLELEIDTPGFGKIKLSTDNGDIIKNSKCKPNNVIDLPDYYSHYKLNKIGKYNIKLKAETKNGVREIIDQFEVKKKLNFEVERIGPTRIYPIANYDIEINIKVNNNYNGDIIETVPASFKIINSKLQINNKDIFDSSFIIENNQNEKQLIWQNLNLKKDDILKIVYTFDAPNISPEFYLLGPLQFLINNKKLQMENRMWQIASDAVNEIEHNFISYNNVLENTLNYDTDGWLAVPQYTIASTTFTTGDKYLIEINFSIHNGSGAGDNSMARVRHGNTGFTDSTFAWESRRNTLDHVGHGYSYFTVWDAVADEDIYIDISAVGGSDNLIRTEGFQAFVINLSDGLTENVDWYFATSTHSGNLPVGWDTNGANITINGNGNDWMLLGMGRFLSDNTYSDFLMRFYNSTDGVSYNQVRYETEDVNDYRPISIMTGINIDSNETWRIEAGVDTANTHDWSDSKIFALNLNKFSTHYIGYNTNAFSISSRDTWVTSTSTTYNAKALGDHLIWSQEVLDTGDNAKAMYSRLMLDGGTVPPEYPGVKRELPAGADDENAHHNIYIGSFNQGNREISVQVNEDTDVNPVLSIDIHNLVIFSMALKSPPTGLFNSIVARTDGTGVVDISIEVNDADLDNSRAQIEYTLGATCDFSSSNQNTIDSTDVNVTADFGDPDIDNNYTYQIGTTSALILTDSGSNTIDFDWNTAVDLPSANKETYCLRLTANDFLADQKIPATTTIIIDNTAPNINNFTIPDLMYAVGDTLTATITVESDIDNFILDSSATINNATTTNLQKISNTIYTVDYIVVEGDVDRASGTIPASIILVDSYGNKNIAYTSVETNTASIDANSPNITQITTESLMYKIGDTLTATITVVADSEVYNLNSGTINNVDVVNLQKINNITYTVEYTIADGNTDRASGTIPISIILTDNYNNTNSVFTTLTSNASIDANKPEISSVYITNGSYGIGNDIQIIIDADEINYSLGNTTINNKSISNFIDNGDTTYEITYTVIEGDTDQISGEIPVSIILVDSYSNENIAYTNTENNTASIDANKPEILTISLPNISYKIGDTVRATTTVNSDASVYTLGTTTINNVDATNLQKINNTTYTFDYIIQSGDTDCSQGTIPISLMLKDSLSQYNNPASTTVEINTASIDANAPVINSVSFNPSSGVLKVGDIATSTITANNLETGILAGNIIKINDKDIKSTFIEDSGGNYFVVYTVNEGDIDHPDGDDLPVYFIIRDIAGNESAVFSSADPSNRPGVDGHSPVVTNISIPNINMKVNDIIIATTTVDDDGGDTYTLTSGTINGFTLNNLTRINNTTYTVQFTIIEGGQDVLAVNNISVENFVIQDTAGNENSAYNTPISQDSDSIDANSPIISNIEFNITSGVLKIGDIATATIYSDGINYTANTITINSVDVSGTLTASSTNNYTVFYTVSEGDNDILDSSDLPINISLKDIAGNESASYTTQATSSRPGVDANKPVISSVDFIPSSGILKIGDHATSTISVSGAETGLSVVSATINIIDVSSTFIDIGGGDYQVVYTVNQGDNNINDIADLPVYYILSDSAGNQSNSYSAQDAANRPGVDADIPIISNVEFNITSGVLKIGDIATATIYSDGINYTANTITINSVDVSGTLTASSTNNYTVFYTVSEGDNDILDSSDLPINISLKDIAGNESASYTTQATSSRPGVDANKPVISGITISNINMKVNDIIIATTTVNDDGGDTYTLTSGTINGFTLNNLIRINNTTYTVQFTIAEGGQDVLAVNNISVENFVIQDTAGNENSAYNTPISQDSDLLDANTPTIPGNLNFDSKDNYSITIQFGATTTENNFSEYKIFYKLGSSGVTENNLEFNYSNDPSLGNINFNNNSTTTITGLNIGSEYVFNIWAYDEAGNKANAITEFNVSTNHAPDNANNLKQYDINNQIIANNNWTNNVDINLESRVIDSDINSILTMYFEVATSTDSFTNSISNACAYNANWDDCNSKVWATTSPSGNYNINPFITTTTPTSIADSSVGYKWQIKVCDEYNACSDWVIFNASIPNFKVDHTLPTEPGNLTENSKNSTSVILNLTGITTEINFSEYKIFYKIGSSEVTESDLEFNYSNDPSLGNINFNNNSTTTIDSLSAGTEYTFNIWAYDEASNTNNATEITITTPSSSNPPTGSFNSITQKTDGSGIVDIAILIDDPDNDDTLRAKIEVATGTTCDFTSSLDPNLDSSDQNITATYGDPDIDNDYIYQVGTSTNWIWTSPGINTINFDWLSKNDIPLADGEYCLRLTANDESGDQIQPATTTLIIDNINPTSPGVLSLNDKTTNSLILNFGATTTENNFSEYKIFYKIGSSEVTESDLEFNYSNDPNLGNINFNNNSTTIIDGLFAGTEYTFNIWAYDDYGNKSSSTMFSAVTNYTTENPTALTQYKSDITEINNGQWISENTIKLIASAIDNDSNEIIKLYFEVATSTDSFTNSISNACAYNANWNDCNSKVWATTSPIGNYSVNSFTATITPMFIPNSSVGYKWQVMACDDDGACSSWQQYNVITPNFKVDYINPTPPGELSIAEYDSNSVTLSFGDSSTENNFSEYIIYYKIGTSGVNETNTVYSSSTDSNLGNKNYNNATSTKINELLSGTNYVFNIYAYDQAGNKSNAVIEATTTTNSLPTGSFLSATTKMDGAGIVDISIIANDSDYNNSRAKIQYEEGAGCEFLSSSYATIDEIDENATSTYFDAKIENDNEYQIGNNSGWIITTNGANTINFDWLSEDDLVDEEGTYCLRLIVNDNIEDQAVYDTTTITIDNKEPTAPGDLSLFSRSGSEMILSFGETTTETNFSKYRMFYKKGVSTIDENDSEHFDDDLNNINYNNTSTTTINELDPDAQYSFRIYAYDAYGNKTSSNQVTFQTNAVPNGSFNSTILKINGSGVADINITVYDSNGDDCQAKLEYVSGTTCDFSSPLNPSLDENTDNISSNQAIEPEIDNNNEYQIGTSTRIITNAGANVIDFDWLSQNNLPLTEGNYCLRLTVNDGTDDDPTPATTTIYIDNKLPDTPGNLLDVYSGSLNIELGFGATSSDTNFSEYKIFYKQGITGVTQNDTEYNQYDDNNLASNIFNNATTTNIDGLSQSMQYVFNIWAYDSYGNTISAITEISTTTTIVPSATWREDEDIVDPTTNNPLGKETPIRLRVAIANNGDWNILNNIYDLEYGQKIENCSDISSWTTVPPQANQEHFEMTDSVYFNNMSLTYQKLSSDDFAFINGYLVKTPSATTSALNLNSNEYTEIEYAIQATALSSAGVTYCFRLTNNGSILDSYDVYPELSLVPKPTGNFVSAIQKKNGSGAIDIIIDVIDKDGDLSKAKIEYSTSTECINFNDLILDENTDNIDSTYGDVWIENDLEYQIGSDSNHMIITQYGTSTVEFDWNSINDIPNQEGNYCLRLTVNDTYDDQIVPATTTIIIDNLSPTNPGNLTINSKTDTSVTLNFGATSSDSNFSEYKIYWKEGASGVTESDEPYSSTTDPNLGNISFNGSATTTIIGLIKNKQYVFKIWAYDEYGNKSSSAGEVSVKLTPSYSGVVYSDNGFTPLLTDPIVSIAIDGIYKTSVEASDVDGSFIFQDIDPQATGTPIVIYLDNSYEKGVAYNRYSGDGEINDFHIYQNQVIVRHDDNGPLAVANIDTFDNDQDSDIICSVTGISFAVQAGYEFYIWEGSEFEAGSGDINFNNIVINGTFTAIGEQNIAVSGNWDATEGAFDMASSTVEFTSTEVGNIIKTNGYPFWILNLNGSGGEWLLVDSATSTATTTITQGTLTQGGDTIFETQNFIIENQAHFIKATGTSKLIFEGLGNCIFEDKNATLNNLGNVQIGYSPAVVRLNSDFLADSLTINESDSLYTRGFEVDITNYITINGRYDCTDDKEGDGTITTLGTDWTLSPSGQFIADISTTTFNGATSSILISGGTNTVHDFNNLYFNKTSTATTSLLNYDLKVSGDIIIGSNSIVDVSNSNYTIYAGGSWDNSGTFIARQATTTFDSVSTGNIINSGNSSFYNVEFNNTIGGWIISNNATTTNNLELINATNFTVNSGVVIEVNGIFNNLINEASASWNSGSTIYLNSESAYTINSKSIDGNNYGIIKIGQNTDIEMWSTNAISYEVNSSGSLYSMDHNDNDGDLYIWGNYNNSNSEYWNYAIDFDGAGLSGLERQCNIKIASSTSLSFSAATLQIIGTSTETTTISNQGAGTYSIVINNGTLNAKYYNIRNTNTQGLNIIGSPVITSLDYGNFELSINDGSMITIANSVLTANPYATTTGCSFATSTGINAGYNINLTGTPNTQWTLINHYGNYDGDNYDNDSGDPRGYIVWDDSPEYIPKSQNWQWYYDEENETPDSESAGEEVAPLTIGTNATLKLRLSINETGNATGTNVKMRLQYSKYSDFSDEVYFVGEIGSTTADWNYGNGVDDDNDAITARVLLDTTESATHNESGISVSSYDHPSNTPTEWEFTVYNNNATTSVIYYFRAYAKYYSVFKIYEKAVIFNTAKSYPSLMVSSSTLQYNITGLASDVIIGDVTTNIETNPNSIDFGNLNNVSYSKIGAHKFNITTNAESGYQLFVYQRQNLISQNGSDINSVEATNNDPSAWPLSPEASAFGYHTTDDTLSSGLYSRFAPDNTYAKFEETTKEISYSPVPVENEIIDFVYRLEVGNMQEAGDYETEIVYIILPTF